MSIASNHKIGHGKNMSIAKAGLKVFFEEKEKLFLGNFINYDDLEFIHRVIDVAGASHCSFLTSPQVINCLYHSSYWDKTLAIGFFKGMRGHGNANSFSPSEKGKKYYLEHLKEVQI